MMEAHRTTAGMALALMLLFSSCAAAHPSRSSPPRLYVSFHAGEWEADEAGGQLTRERDSFAAALRAGYRVGDHLAMEAELAGYSATYDGPPLPPPPNGSYDQRRDIDSSELGFSLKGTYPFHRLLAYGGAGFGIHRATMTAKGKQYVGVWPLIFSTEIERTDDDLMLAPNLAVGVNYLVSRNTYVGVEGKRLWAEGDFGPLSGGKVRIGGAVLLFSLGYLFDWP